MSRNNLNHNSEAFISVIVPVFNEATNIVNNIDLLVSEIEHHFKHFEILIVSDGSTDGTNSAIASFSHPAIRLLENKENMGKGYSIRAGLKQAKGDYIFFIDGGMELHPKELRVFLGLIELYNADIVIGSKRHPQSQIIYPWYRKFLSLCYQLLIRFLFNVRATDTQVGIKLFKREVIVAILPYLEINRYGFDLEMLSLAQLFGYGNILEAPVRLDYFLKSRRFIALEMSHVFKIGLSLLSDTFRLYLKLQKLKGIVVREASKK